jgi:hypothetical protein
MIHQTQDAAVEAINSSDHHTDVVFGVKLSIGWPVEVGNGFDIVQRAKSSDVLVVAFI